jgi:FAD binding domain-containing protein
MSVLSIDTQPPSSADVRALRSHVSGEIVLPCDAAWDGARQAWNLAVDQRPFAVARVGSTDDVAEIVRFARVHGLRIAPQGTGHGASALPDLEDANLVRAERMRGVEIGAAARQARVEAEPLRGNSFVVVEAVSPARRATVPSWSHRSGRSARRWTLRRRAADGVAAPAHGSAQAGAGCRRRDVPRRPCRRGC